MKIKISVLAIMVLVMALATVNASAQTSPSPSDKVFFAHTTDDVTLAGTTESVSTGWRTILEGEMKTSNVGGLLIGVSMECALWTNTITTATSGGGKSSSSAQAGVQVRVMVDGQQANEDIVFCDRLQRVGLNLTTGVATDTLTLELFQATKSANHFNFYAENTHGSAFMHQIEVQAKGNVECLDTTSNVVACPSSFDSGTKAAIGKRTVVIENVNNFGTY